MSATLVTYHLGLYYLIVSCLQNILFAILIFAWHDSAVVDIPKFLMHLIL